MTQDFTTASGVVFTVTTNSYWLISSAKKYSYGVVIKSPNRDTIFSEDEINRGTTFLGFINIVASGDVILGDSDSNTLVSGMSIGNYVSVPGSTGSFNVGLGILVANTYYIGGDTSINGGANIAAGSKIFVVGGTAELGGTTGAAIGALSGTSVVISYDGTFGTGASLAAVLSGCNITFGEGKGTLLLNGGGNVVNLLANSSFAATVIQNYDPSIDIIQLRNTIKQVVKYTITSDGLSRSSTSNKAIALYAKDGSMVAQYSVAVSMLDDGTYAVDTGNNPLMIRYENGDTYVGGADDNNPCFLPGSMILTPNNNLGYC